MSSHRADLDTVWETAYATSRSSDWSFKPAPTGRSVLAINDGIELRRSSRTCPVSHGIGEIAPRARFFGVNAARKHVRYPLEARRRAVPSVHILLRSRRVGRLRMAASMLILFRKVPDEPPQTALRTSCANHPSSMLIPGLTESALSQHASHDSLRRGRDYFEAGAVSNLVRRGSVLHASVEGSDYAPYAVRIHFDDSGIRGVECMCPYSYGGWCKHVVAVLLTCIRNHEMIDERPALRDLIDRMTRDQLADLVERMASENPHLIERIEQICVTPAGEGGDRTSVVDQLAVQQRVASILHSLDHMRPSHAYSYVSSIVKEIEDEVENAWMFIRAGDARGALESLEAITGAYVDGWIHLDDSDGALGELFFELGTAWTEALLVGELASEERRAWSSKLDAWQDEIYQYGIDGAFEPAIVAAEEGWNAPDLTAILQGDGVIRIRPWRVDERWEAEQVTDARLRILERREEYDAYLRLAGSEGYLEAFLTMLVRIGLIDEAVEQCLELMTETDQAFALARVLREEGALEEALRVGEHGLRLEGYFLAPLAEWVSALAGGMGETERALKAAIIAVGDRPTLASFRRVKQLAGEDWPAYRESLLDGIRASRTYGDDRVDILLHEGLIEEAVAVANRHPEDFRLVRRVVQAAADVRPDWVVLVAKHHAERIMDEGRSAYYDHAVDWLESVRDAYMQLGDETAWRDYLAAITSKHRRKYKLMRLMEEQL